MIFSELYSAYYNAVARILSAASEPGVTPQDLQQIVLGEAFSESTLTILPALRSGKWPLLHSDLTSVLYHTPTMPLTLLEKRWLKALMDDPRLKLFPVSMPELEGIPPLFSREDYRIFDCYEDGDPYEDETYIRNFRVLLDAIHKKRPVQVTLKNQWGKELQVRFYPIGMEYSAKDDKFRVLADRCWSREFNVGRILTCEPCPEDGPWAEAPPAPAMGELTLLVIDGRNALERVMLHFAHFEKRAERTDDGNYLLRLKYQLKDEPEIVIRVLSFGCFVKVLSPDSFVDRIREKLLSQKSCEL